MSQEGSEHESGEADTDNTGNKLIGMLRNNLDTIVLNRKVF